MSRTGTQRLGWATLRQTWPSDSMASADANTMIRLLQTWTRGRVGLAGCLAVVTGLLASACAPEPQPLRLGNNLWPGYELAYLSRSLGYDDGVDVRLIDYSSTSDVVRAYRAGQLDVAAVTADEALLASSDGQHRIVLVCDTSNGADVIVAGRDIGSVGDLRGKRVGVETTALGAYVLARALALNGMTTADVTVVSMPLSEHVGAFLAKRVDAIVTFEPNRSRLLALGAQVVFDSSMLPGEIADVFLTRTTLSASQEASLKKVVRGWFRARTFLLNHPEDAAQRVAPRLGLSVATFLDSLALLQIPDRSDNLRMLGGDTPGMQTTLEALATQMRSLNLIGPDLAPPRLDPSFVESAEP